MRRKMILFVAVFLSDVSVAAEFDDLDRHRGVVDEYRELRKLCAKSEAEFRVACFRQLNEKNSEYQSAKKALAEQKPNNLGNNLHVVSNVY